MGNRGRRNSLSLTAAPPRAAYSHSASVGRRRKPATPSSLGKLPGALAYSHSVYFTEKATASLQLMDVFGRRPILLGLPQFPFMTASYWSVVTSYLPI